MKIEQIVTRVSLVGVVAGYLLVACQVGAAKAAWMPISVANDGFEQPGSDNAVPTSWTPSDSSNAIEYALSSLGLSASGHGTWGLGLKGTASVAAWQQVLDASSVQPNTDYRLTVAVGGRLSTSDWAFGGSTIALINGAGTTLASTTINITDANAPNASWVDSMVTLTTGTSVPAGSELS